MKKIIVATLRLAGTLALQVALATANAQQDAYQMSISFPGYSGQRETLQNFPMLVVLTNNVGGSTFDLDVFPFANPDGWDLRFYDATNTELQYEFDTFDPANNSVLAWVLLPELDPGGTTIRAGWGDQAKGRQASTRNGAVWADGFHLVQHYTTGAGSTVTNANAVYRPGTIYNPNTIIGPQYVPGRIGNAVNLKNNARNTGIQMNPAIALNGTNVWTVSVWFKDLCPNGSWRTLTRGASHHHIIVESASTDSSNTSAGRLGAYVGAFRPARNASNQDARLPFADGWRHLTAVAKGTVISYYVDGVWQGDMDIALHGSYNNATIMDSIIGIGCYQSPDQKFADYLDEFRAAGRVRSADWIFADFASQGGDPAFTAYGNPASGDKPILSVQAANPYGATNATFNGWMAYNGDATPTVFWCDAAGVATNSFTLSEQAGGAVTYHITGLAPATAYLCWFTVTNTPGVGAWTEEAAPARPFTTRPVAPVIAMLAHSGVGFTNATTACHIEWAGIDEAADLTVWYGVEQSALNLSATLQGVGVGNHQIVLTGLEPDTTYWYRWKADDVWAAGVGTFKTLQALTLSAPTAVEWTNATVNCSVLYAGPANAAELKVWYGTTDGGTSPSSWQASASATVSIGARSFVLKGLSPGTTYHYRWQLAGVWYGGGTFTTFPAFTIPAPINVGWNAATVRLDFQFTDIAPALNVSLHWGLDPSALVNVVDKGSVAYGTTVSETLTGLSPLTVYYYRWKVGDAWSEVMTFATVQASAVNNLTWLWTGEGQTSNFSDTDNWRLTNNTGRHPDTSDELYNSTLWFWGDFPHTLNQDLDFFTIRLFLIGDSRGGGTIQNPGPQYLNNDLVITNKPIVFLERYREVTWFSEQGKPAYNVRFYNDVFAAANGGNFDTCYPLTFHGAISEFGGSKVFTTGGWSDRVHFRGPVNFTGGFGSGANFYGQHTTGLMPPAAKSDYYRNGNFYFHSPDGAPYEYEIPAEKGFMTACSIRMAAGITVVVNSPVSGTANLEVWGTNPGCILELNAPHNPVTGGIILNNTVVHVILRGTTARGAPGTVLARNGGMDLDGQDIAGRDFDCQYSEARVYNDGLLRNQNPDRESLFDADMTKTSYLNNTRQFGGVGDIKMTGDIANNGNATFIKPGPGTLTLAGTTSYNARFEILHGALTLDYGAKNTRKLGGPDQDLYLSGNLALLGAADTFEEVKILNIGSWVENSIRIAAQSATFKFNGFTLASRSTLDFADNGGGVFLAPINIANNAVMDVWDTRVTYGGKTFARLPGVADSQHPGHQRVGGVPDSAYVNAFDSGTWYEMVDVPGDITAPSNERAGVLRFNAQGPATVAITDVLQIAGYGNTDNGYGAVLVTENVGPNEVAIAEPGYLDLRSHQQFSVHQYNTAAPLVISARIRDGGGSLGFLKTGPGELILTHPNSNIQVPNVFEGTLTYTSIADTGTPSALGSGDYILLANATLRYAGDDPAGHKTNRRVLLRGKGVLDASGAGPLTFSAADLLTTRQHVDIGQTHMLTLGGGAGGVGIIEGRINLGGGRLRKQGEGEWILANTSTNSFTWGTDVLGGTLTLNGFLGRDVTVYGGRESPRADGGTIKGSGTIERNLILEPGATLGYDPKNAPLTVGKNLVIKPGALLNLPRRLPSDWTPLVKVNGKITGTFAPPNHAYVKIENNILFIKQRPVGTMLMVR